MSGAANPGCSRLLGGSFGRSAILRRTFLCHSAARAPVILQHSPSHQIQPAVVDPLSIACHAFAREPQALGNRATARVPHAALDGHPVQAQIVEQVVQQALAATRDNALAPITLLDPVADAAIPVGPVDGMAAYRTGEGAVDPDAALWSPAGSELLAHLQDKAPQVLVRRREIHPRQPLAQGSAIAVHHGEDRLGISRFEQPYFDSRGHPAREHSPSYAPLGFCGLMDFDIAGISGVSCCNAYTSSPVFSNSNALAGSSAN